MYRQITVCYIKGRKDVAAKMRRDEIKHISVQYPVDAVTNGTGGQHREKVLPKLDLAR